MLNDPKITKETKAIIPEAIKDQMCGSAEANYKSREWICVKERKLDD